MSPLKLHAVFFLSILFFSCKSQVKPQVKPIEKLFIVETRSLTADTVVTSAILFDGQIICLQEDHKIFVLDSLLNRNNELTAKFSNLKVDFLEKYNDTIFIGTDKENYILDKGFALKNYNWYPFRNRSPDYDVWAGWEIHGSHIRIQDW